MATLFDATPSSVLAIYAHPDDADVAAAGALARWSNAGAAVHLVIVCTGGFGTIDASLSPSTLAASRLVELETAAKATGVSFEVLGFDDGAIENTTELRADLVGLIRSRTPELVLSHDPTAVFFGQHYYNHRDHRALGFSVLDAVAPAANLPHYFSDRGPSHAVSSVLLSGTLEPDTYVDISSTIEAKIDAVGAHASQLAGDGTWALDAVRQRAIDDGAIVGVRHAEGFRLLRPNG